MLVTNDTPPNACLSYFNFITIPLDPDLPESYDPKVDHSITGTMSSGLHTTSTERFKSPEQINPEKFGMSSRAPTQESDIYSFGMATLQVLE